MSSFTDLDPTSPFTRIHFFQILSVLFNCVSFGQSSIEYVEKNLYESVCVPWTVFSAEEGRELLK